MTPTRSFLLAAVLSFAAFSVAAAPAVDLFPTSDTPAGGAMIQVRLGNGQTFFCSVVATCLPSVTFDGIGAEVVQADAHLVVVKAPPHPRGAVKVVVFTGSTVVEGSFHYLAEEDWEQFLVPVSLVGEINGAFGSRWTTDVRIGNSSVDEAFDVRAPLCNLLISPTPIYVHLPPGVGPAHVTPLSCGSIGTPGAFIYVPKWAVPIVYANARVQDVSRQSETWGTEEPVVRSLDFQSDIVLPNIPNDSRFRTTLRIYAPSPRPVRIRIWPLDSSDKPIVDVTRSLAGVVTLLPVPFPTEPSYLELLLESFPEVAGQGPLRVELSDTPDFKAVPPGTPAIWGFASVTNNATQHVTLVTPQPIDRR
jgi:hypothetical protein